MNALTHDFGLADPPRHLIAPILAWELDTCRGYAAILATLYAARGRWVSTERLNQVSAPLARGFDHAKDRRNLNNVKVIMFKLRQRLGDDIFESEQYLGYRLTDTGAALVRSTWSDVR